MAKLLNGNYSKTAFKKACVKAIELTHSIDHKFSYANIGTFTRESDGHTLSIRYEMKTNRFELVTVGINKCHFTMLTVRGTLDFAVRNNYRYVTIGGTMENPYD